MTLEEVRINIAGMTCAACVSSVEKIILAQEGVESASVNLALNNAQISIDLNIDNVLQDIISAINRGKYNATVVNFGADDFRN